jgi:EAL domain-containing protein (putative c-di-GMP-specific phosphodiesterase class I)
MAQPLDVEDGETFISLSIGAALSSGDWESGPTLLRNADIAMYRAKELGPARIEIFTADDARLADTRLQTSDQMHRALQRQEFELHYQPFVHLDTLRVVATEALIRWRHPTRGLLLPAEFVGLAEDTGLIVPLGRWVLEEACAQAVRWQSLRNEGSRSWKQNISINVSPRQLSEPSFASQLDEIIEHTGIDPDTLWLEITEGTLLRDPERSVGTLRAVRSLGAHIAIDDFGTGYSSLSYLKQLPVESLKIDRSFVEGLGHDSESSAIVRAVIALADSMGLACIAEGVETSEQAQILRQLGCHIAQGYLFGRALSAAQLGSSPVDDLHSWDTAAALM